MSPNPDTERNTKNALEWTVFGLSLLLVIAAISILAYLAIRQKDSPADLKTEVGEIIRRDDGFVVPVHLSNRGSRTASEVNVAVDATFPDGTKTATLTLDFVPRGGKREGFAVFPGNQKPENVMPRITGYMEP